MNTAQHLSLLEWLALHPGAGKLRDHPDWYRHSRGPDETGGPHWEIAVRHQDGREFTFRLGMWMRGAPFKQPLCATWDHAVLVELHGRYPVEFPDDPVFAEPDYPLSIHLNDAFDAFVNDDMDTFWVRMARALRTQNPKKWGKERWVESDPDISDEERWKASDEDLRREVHEFLQAQPTEELRRVAANKLLAVLA